MTRARPLRATPISAIFLIIGLMITGCGRESSSAAAAPPALDGSIRVGNPVANITGKLSEARLEGLIKPLL